MFTGKAWRTSAVGVLLLSTLLVIAGEPPKATKLSLGGIERYLTHLSTDKPIYRPGEKFYLRAVMLRADNHMPLPGDQPHQAMVEIKGPKGDVVASGLAQIQDGVAGMSWQLPAGMAGGEYTAKVSHPWSGHAPGERKFDIRAYRAPRLKSQIVFVRDGYGPGDMASASVHVDRAEGGIPQGAKVTAVARVDGVEVHRGETKIDANGNASVQFKLPAEIARGEGTLAWIIEDGGVVETATKTIPILLQTVDLTMYPEGGDLVLGLAGRVYVEAFTPAKNPADLKAVVVDSKGKELVQFKTEHEGRGRFEITPAKGEKYAIKIVEPAGIKTTYPLPEAKEGAAVLRAVNEVTEKGQPVKLHVAALQPQRLLVTLSKREVRVAMKEVPVGPSLRDGWTEVWLTPQPDVDGVLIATVWDAQGKPLAERLVFRRPAKEIKVEVLADQTNYVPAAPVKLTVKTSDAATGEPIGAMVGLTVTDDSVLEMIEKREKAPRLPVMVLLEADVKELADAHLYLDRTDPKAPLATDLLLGTQGWRRFAFVDPVKFVAEHGERARRVLALRLEDARIRTRMRQAGGGGGFGGGGFAEEEERLFRLGAVDRFDVLVAAAVPKEQKGLEEVPKQIEVLAGEELRQGLQKAEARDEAKLMLRGFQGREVRNDFVAVREYAHRVRADRKANDRVDFAETIYWNAGVKTDAKTGVASVEFTTSDAVTAFCVFADALGGDGALGSGGSTIESVQPFYVEPKLPLQVSQGDVIQLPVAVINGMSTDLAGASLVAKGGRGLTIGQLERFDLKGKERLRRLFQVKAGQFVGFTDLALDATAGEFSDKVTRKLEIQPIGFPAEIAFGGLIGPDNSVSHQIEIPADVVAGSIISELSVFPTPLANMTQALEQLIRQPYGCFEQTSSTSYPLVMAQQYFMSHSGVDPKLIERSREMLDASYNRLIGFECKQSKGFEWFGADPGHEALSAYGLMQFADMAQVREVDGRMLADTRRFVLNQRDGKGGFKRERATLHTWVTDPECSNGYILWSLLESGEKPESLAKEITALKELVMKSSNSYAMALGANVLALANDKAGAKALMDKLASKQTKQGYVDGATQSVIGSGGEALQVEATALAALAWMRDPAYAANVEMSMKWLAEMCKGGRFGSTQSTVLALKAVVTYDKLRSKVRSSGSVQVVVDGKAFGVPSEFTPETQSAVVLQNIAEAMTPGRHTVELRMDRGSPMPYSILVRFHRVQPESAEQCKVRLAVALKDKEIVEGNVTEANVTVINKDAAAVPTPVAIVGIPAGLEVRHDQLKELVKSGRVDAYEVIGRDVVLYWRELKGAQKVELPISLIAAIPGEYRGPASRAYLYYTDEHKQWVDGVGVKISPQR